MFPFLPPWFRWPLGRPRVTLRAAVEAMSRDPDVVRGRVARLERLVALFCLAGGAAGLTADEKARADAEIERLLEHVTSQGVLHGPRA